MTSTSSTRDDAINFLTSPSQKSSESLVPQTSGAGELTASVEAISGWRVRYVAVAATACRPVEGPPTPAVKAIHPFAFFTVFGLIVCCFCCQSYPFSDSMETLSHEQEILRSYMSF